MRALCWETLEARHLLASDWNNVLQPLNVKGDEAQTVTPLDVLLVINEINSPTIRASNSSPLPPIGSDGKLPPPFVDVDCDNFVTPLDVLIIINAINSKNFGPSWRFSQNGGGSDAGSVTPFACSPKLQEGSSFTTSLFSDIVIPEDANLLSFEYTSLSFDTSSQGRAHDAFEAALLDSTGHSLVQTLGAGRDAFFNVTEGLPVANTGNVTMNGNKVSLSLADVLPGTKAQLVLRLVNNDGDKTTSVVVPSIRLGNNPALRSSSSSTAAPSSSSNLSTTGGSLFGPSNGQGASVPGEAVLPGPNVVVGRPISGGNSNGPNSNEASKPPTNPESPAPPVLQGPLNSRGKEFWVGFPDNLFEGNNRPQKVLYISGEVATTGVVDIPGLIDPSTTLPFHKDFIVNPGVVTVVELPSLDVGDINDNGTDFDVEAELIAKVERRGVHVVTQETVAVYGLDLAVSTSDAFLALPVTSLGKEYINLGYENTYASIAHVEGTQFLVVATEDNTQVTLEPGQYTYASNSSNASIKRPDGTTYFNLGNSDGRDIGPFVTDAAGNYSLTVSPPADGYSGTYRFEVVDVATAATPANLGDKVTVNFPTGRESKVVSFDVVAGQHLYYDAINPSPSPNATIRILSASGDLGELGSQTDSDSFTNYFGALVFRETGKYYFLITGEQSTAFDFSFRLMNMDVAPKISFGTDYNGSFNPAGRAEIYRLDGIAGQVLYYDALTQDRLSSFSIYGPGGQQVFSTASSDGQALVLAETSTYFIVVDSASFAVSSFGFRLLDLKSAPPLALGSPTTTNVATGYLTSYRFSGEAAQAFSFDIQNVTPFFRVTYQLFDPAGNAATLAQIGNKLSASLMTSGTYSLLIGALTVGEGGSVTILPSLVNDPIIVKSGFNTNQTLAITSGTTATYQFSAPAGTRILVDSLDTTNENLYVILNAPDGTRLYTGFGAANEQQDIPRYGPAFLPQSGTYTLTLGGFTPSDSGSYKFRVLDLDTFGTPLSLDTVVNGNFPTGREALVYSFDSNVGDKLLFDGRSGAFIFGIYDESLNSIYGRGIFGAASVNEVDGVGRVLRSGRHYVLFQGDPSVPQDFSFAIQNLSLAPSLVIGAEAVGTVLANGQFSYRMQLTAGQRIRLDNLMPFATEVNYRIANSGGRVLFDSGFQNNDSGPPGNQLIIVPESGEYFVSIQSRQPTSGNFRFRIDDLALAPLLTFDSDLEVALNPGNTAQVFRIDANAGETIQLDNFGSFLPLNWEISGPTTQFRGGSNNGSDFSATVLSSGTHFFTISGRDSGPINIRFRATRTPGPFVPMTGVNAPVNLDVGINDSKTYSFSLPTGRLVYLNVMKSDFKIPTHTVTLNQGETYLLRDLSDRGFATGPDLSGSIITSTKPVAVFGGNRASFVPSQYFAADHLVEQLPPTNTWGSEFATMPLVTGSSRGDRFRFLAQADNTQVTVNGTVVATLNRGQFYEQVVVGPGHIVATKPILVAQYAHSQQYYQADPGGNPTFQGDPLMMIVPPFEQFLANYTVSTPVESSILNAQRFDRNYINIVAPAEAVGLIEIDGVLIDAAKFAPIGTSGFSGVQVAVSLGGYQLAGPLPFGVFVYGFGSFDSYGYVGGQALSPVATVSSVVLTPATANPQIGNSLSLTARVADVSGAPLQGIRVDFDVAGVNPQRGFGFSDASGLVQFSFTGTQDGRDIVTASVGQLLDDSIIDWRTGAAAPQVIVAAPLNGSAVVAGTTLVATGIAIADFPSATLDLVTVNGVPLTSVDAAGNFFVQLFVGPGENEFEFAAIDSKGNTGSQVITIRGTQLDTTKIDITQFADVTGSFRETYARTSFNQSKRSLLAETAIENIGQFPTDVPLLVGITNISDPMVLVRGTVGQTPDGIPYYDFTGLVTGGTLNPRGKTGLFMAEFYNPNQTQFTYDLVFYGKLNVPPRIDSLPPTETDLNREYRYDVIAVDPNLDAIAFELVEAPAGMSINSTNGQIRWTPTDSDDGLHTVEIRVSDPRLGVSTQRYTLSARPTPANLAPVFTSFPVAVADVGRSYPYTAQAVDADGDVLGYRLVSGPNGMTIDALSGTIQWVPTPQQLGAQPVVIEVSDSLGGSAEQSFSLLVLSPADNAAPAIVSLAPTAIKRSGLTYQVIALDADSEPLAYRLSDAPAGMTISSTGLINWTPTAAQIGPHQVSMEVLDTRGGRVAQSFVLALFDNEDPVITSQPVTTAQLNSPYSYLVKVTDSIDDLLSFKLIDAPVGMTINASSGQISWDVTNAAYEHEPVTIGVFDGRGGMAKQQFVIAVTGGQSQSSNIHPVFVSAPPTVASVGTTLLYQVQARDPDGDSLTYDLPLSPSGMVIDATSGQLGWLPQPNQAGMQQVVIRVKDRQGGIWLQSFQIDVDGSNTAPAISSLPSTNASVGIPWEYRLHVQDSQNDPMMFELVSPASGMTLTPSSNADANAVLSFTPIAAGQVEVVLVAKDNRGGQTEQRFTVNVAATTANVAPIIHSTPRLKIPAGQTWVYLVSANDPNGDPITLSLPTAPAGMTLDASMRLASWTPTLSQIGSHAILLSVSDGRGGLTTQSVELQVVSDSYSATPIVVSPPSAFRATVGESFQYDLKAADDDNDPVEWTLVDAPHGTSIDRRYGTLRWTPTIDQLGLQRFVISAKDPLGLEAQQSFSLLVSGANLGPSILSRALSEAVVDDRYVYGVRAIDPENDPLVFALPNGPAGMTIDAARGIIRWTPTLGQLGIANIMVEVTDARGNKSTQRFQINVTQVVRNKEPIITSRAIFRARVDALYQYDVNAIDPEGDIVSYSLVSAPTGMQIDSSSGLVTWTPIVAQAGSHLVQVAAQDSAGGRSVQRFAVLARINQAPVVSSRAVTSVALGGTYYYDLQVTDPEGDALSYELVTGPTGMTIDSLGRVMWQTEPGVPVSNPVALRVTDSYGAVATQVYVLAVTPDTTAPRVELRLSSNPVVLGQNTVVVVQATDNVGVVDLSLTMNGQPLVLDANNSITLEGNIAGLYVLRATARDASGNEGNATASLRVFDPTDTRGPTIRLTSPKPNAIVTTLTDIVGSITDDNLQFYRIDYGRADLVNINQPEANDPDYKTLVTRNAAAVDSVLATFDPTMLVNDDYVIRIFAQDLSGNISTKVVPLSLDGQLKLGEYNLDFNDLVVPVSGFPITIQRSYNTRTAGETGDFGYGWTLSLLDANIRETIPVTPLEQLGVSFAATPFRDGTRVYLTNPEGRRVGFTFRPTLQFSLFGGGSFAPAFVPDPGVVDKLDVGSVPLRKIDGSYYSAFFGEPFNPNSYRLTTKDGTVYEYGQFGGLDNVHDRNGNRLEFRPDGIFSSDGQSVQFVRDPQGRIAEILDPAGRRLRYEYNLAGELIKFTDQNGLNRKYSYFSAPSHFLSTIIDPNGKLDFSAQFDANGRLISSSNAIGASLRNSFDMGQLIETTTDPLGNKTSVQFDNRGNIVRSVQPNGGIQSMQYDTNDNLTKATDEAGNSVTQSYDSNGNLTRIVDPTGAIFASEFNSTGEVIATTDPLGRRTQFVYDLKGNLTSFVNATGVLTSASYDDQGRVTSTTDGNGSKTILAYGAGAKATKVTFAGRQSVTPVAAPTKQFQYNELGLLVQETDENGNITRYSYDATGRPVSTTDALGASYRYRYDGSLLVEGTDPLGRSTRLEYDDLGRKVREIDPAGGIKSLTHDANNQITSTTDALGRITRYGFRPDGRLESEQDPAGNVTRYEYNAIGHRTLVIDANGQRWTYLYDALGRQLSETDPLGATSQTIYDAAGNKIAFTDANGHTTRYIYDNLNRLIQLVDPLGNRFSVRYDDNSQPIELTSSNGSVSQYEYDEFDRLVLAIDSAGATRSQTFDAYGNRTSVTNEVGDTIQFTYDAANRGVATRDSKGATTTRVLDAFGNSIRFRNELGQTANFELDPLNRLISTSTADGRIHRTQYDAVGNNIRFIDASGNVTSMAYDSLNRVTRHVDPLGHSTQYSYDSVSNLTSKVDRNGRESRYDYDAARRLTSEKWFAGASLVNSIDTAYDPVGNLTRARDNTSSLVFSYDALNRIATQDNDGTAGVPRLAWSSTFDVRGNLTGIQDSFGAVYSKTIDGRNRTTSASLSGGIDSMRVDFGYDAKGQRTSATRFSDLTGTQRSSRTSWLYNAQGQLTDLTHFNALDAVLADYSYSYDPYFKLTDESGTAGSATYSYDDAGQLLSADRVGIPLESYQYDVSGNRRGNGIVVGINNQLLSDNTYRYAYDNEGNLVAKTNIATNEATAFTYDHRNRMTRVEKRNTAGTLLSAASFGYDVLDRRILATSNGALIATVYAGDNAWADFDGAGNLVARYLIGERTDEMLARFKPGEGVTWYLGDRLGSIRDLVDSSGAIVDHVNYDSFGNVLNESNPGRGDRFKYTGREFDSVSGLYYYRARYYDPGTGKFVSEDPLSFEAGDANLRRYVGNDPINATDPSGLQGMTEADGLSAFVSVYANYVLTYGADVPFTYRIGCKAGACSIGGTVGGNNASYGGVPIPGTKGKFPIGVTVGSAGFSGAASVNVGPFTAQVSIDQDRKINESIGLNGPFSPSFGSDEAKLPTIPNFPRSGEFNFLVESTATSPHLVISADLAIFVGVAQQLELIGKVAAASDLETAAAVAYEAKSDNPKAAVKARGFATFPARGVPDSGSNGTNPNSNSNSPNGSSNPPPNGDSGDDGDDGDEDSGEEDEDDGETYEFGPEFVASIGDFVWHDVNKDGVQSSGEPGVDGVLVRLFMPGPDGLAGTNDDRFMNSIRTDFYGYYVFGFLEPGRYFIQFDLTTLPIGFVPTVRNVGNDDRDSDADSLGRGSITDLEAGEVDLTHDLGIRN